MKRRCLVALGAVVVGVISHLLLDFLPHYAWIVYLDWFNSYPYRWLIREAACGAVVAIPILMISGRMRPYVLCGMFGGLYPDIEKVLSLTFQVPDSLILFDWHSTKLSARTWGLPISILITLECLMTLACLAIMWSLSRRHDAGEK
jgi:hypothetical protein